MTKDKKRTQKKTTTKNSKNRKPPTLKLDNEVEIPPKTKYIKDTKYIKINDIDINKMRVSEKKIYIKQHNLYKYYVFYEHDDDEYNIPLKIVLKDAVGYYNDYKDNSKYDAKYSAKRMNLKLDDDSLDKAYDIFGHTEKKIRIDLNDFTYESNRGEEYLKTN